MEDKMTKNEALALLDALGNPEREWDDILENSDGVFVNACWKLFKAAGIDPDGEVA